MKNSGKLIMLFTAFTVLIFLYSCNKNEDVSKNKIAITSTDDYLKIADAFSLAAEEEITTDDESLKSASLSSCLTVTIHENENGEFWPRSWTLDYGTENCECFLGNMKRGMIHVNLSDWWRNEGSERQITFEDFYMNDNKMEGFKTILNTGLNDAGNLTFLKKVADAKLTNPDGLVMTWECEKTSEQIEGGETLLFADDVWSVTGSGSGVNLDGNSYTMEITSALIYKNGCFYPLSGTIEIKTDGENSQTINYGEGECDKLITVTTDGVTETVEL
ncbi:hypothetical protein [uncultured Draconibacterium sp.]|uniref:hypothetical protein n=1 Tax=uncultured Draconibacterium sp. TaxID=1573823 RepID=UPI0032172885